MVFNIFSPYGGMVDAVDSKSTVRKNVLVQVRLGVLENKLLVVASFFYFITILVSLNNSLKKGVSLTGFLFKV